MSLIEQIKAAAWRENLARYRERPAPPGAREGAFNQLAFTEPPGEDPIGSSAFDGRPGPAEDPVQTLESILGAPVPEQLAAELASAADGHAVAVPRAAERARHLAALADRAGVASLARLVAGCTRDVDTTARLLETLATEGHQLHPCARTRLGWERGDFERYDLETPRPIGVRLIADRAGVLERSGGDFREHPMLAGLDLPEPVLPVHPWQLEHRILPAYGPLFASGRLAVMAATVPAWPTAAIRTLAGHRTSGYLKLALGIHITSTRRDISPSTAKLAPYLSGVFASLYRSADGGDERRHRIVHDTAGAWLPGARDFTAIARDSLRAAVPAGAVGVPATALAATSPVTGVSLAAEYADWSGDAEAWVRDYARLFVPPILHKAARGVGLEAHLQNSLVAMRGPVPVTPITRDLGGARIHVPSVGARLELPADSPVNAASMDQVRSKVAYTLFQNHLAALVAVLERDCGIDAAAFWADLADLIAGLPLPEADRDCYLAPQLPTKALLTMRLHPGREIESLVDSPLARGRR